MKFYYITILIILSLISFCEAQELTMSEKEEIISYLDSTNFEGAINSILNYKIIEAKEKIEQVFWNNNFDIFNQYRLLKGLYLFNSAFTQTYALAFIDTLVRLNQNDYP